MGTNDPTTEVDLGQVQNARVWLSQARDHVVTAIAKLVDAPGKIGNAPINPNDTNSGKPGQTPTPLTAGGMGGSAPPALLSEVGYTHFGLFPNGLDVAHRHAVAYNASITNLNLVLDGLTKALKATDYIIANYKKVEDDTLASFQKVLTDPPYEPPPPAPAVPARSLRPGRPV